MDDGRRHVPPPQTSAPHQTVQNPKSRNKRVLRVLKDAMASIMFVLASFVEVIADFDIFWKAPKPGLCYSVVLSSTRQLRRIVDMCRTKTNMDMDVCLHPEI